MGILASIIRSDTHSLALEALFIREVKPFLNTQNTKEQDNKMSVCLYPPYVHNGVCYSLGEEAFEDDGLQGN